jgi:hypothetical protein
MISCEVLKDWWICHCHLGLCGLEIWYYLPLNRLDWENSFMLHFIFVIKLFDLVIIHLTRNVLHRRDCCENAHTFKKPCEML